jgi:hypothetical protein
MTALPNLLSKKWILPSHLALALKRGHAPLHLQKVAALENPSQSPVFFMSDILTFWKW